MSKELKPYKVLSHKFKGKDGSGRYVYEITLNQSLVHTGRHKGIEQGLDEYRRKEILDREEEILKEAEEIRSERESTNK